MAKIGAGYAAVGKAQRSMIDRGKKTNMWENIISDVGSAGIFAAGKIKEAKTAWKEYETGYKKLGGEGFERPKFGQKGFFKGPEGEVRIGGSIYDRSKIQEAGAFLGSEKANLLSQETRDEYLGRTAPGRDMQSNKIIDEIEYNVNAEGIPISSNIEIPKSFSDMTPYEKHLDLRDGKSKYFPDEVSWNENADRLRSEYFTDPNTGMTDLSRPNDKERNAYNVWNRRYDSGQYNQ